MQLSRMGFNAIHGLLAVVCLPCTVLAADWDVTDTGQPNTRARFTLSEGSWMSVDVSPDGKTLAFDLLGDIYTLPAQGGEATRVHGGAAMQRTPHFSADGQQLLYLSDASGSDNAWVSAIDGSGARQLTFEHTDVLTSPVWGPGDQYIAATRLSSEYHDLYTSELRLYHLGGGSGELLVASPGFYENVHEGQFSPDGRYYYYTQKTGGDARATSIFIDANHTIHAIMQRDLASGETRELLKGFGGATTAQPSPDGRQLAFVRRVKDKTVLFVYDLESGEQRPVFDQLARDMQGEWIAQGSYYPQYDWFPDGRHIAIWGQGQLLRVDTQTADAQPIPFQLEADIPVTDVARFPFDLAPDTITVKAIRNLAVAPGQRAVAFHALGHVWLKTLPDGQPRRVSKATAFEYEPTWSADGKTLAWVQWDDEGGSALQLMPLDGQQARSVVSSAAVIRQPAFSPDGNTLVYQIEPGNKCMAGFHPQDGLYTVPAAGGAPQRIGDAVEAPRFSPDGQRIYFVTDSYVEGVRSSRLESVDRNGQQRREHAVARGSDRHQLTVSPDLQWIAFKQDRQYYVMRLMDAAGPMAVSASGAATLAVKLTQLGGFNLSWSADSSRLFWLLGDSLRQASTSGEATAPPAAIGLVVESDVPTGRVAFVGARLITISGDVIEQGTLVVERNRIVAVGPEPQVSIPADALVIDSRGKTIMPGLVNMHGHLEDCYYQSSGTMPQKQASHYASLAYGITTNFDPYASELPSYAMSEMRNAGVMVGPRTISVGSVLFGRPGKYDPVYEPIGDLTDAENVMARKVALGGQVIKSYRQPLRRQRQQIIKAARDAGLMVAVEGESHIYNNISAIIDGHSSLEHNIPLAHYYDDIVQLFAHSRTAHTPTLAATFGEMLGENYMYQHTRSWDDPRIAAYVPQVNSGYSPVGVQYSAPLYARAMTGLHAADELWDVGFRGVARSLKTLDDAGVLVNVGSHSQVQGLAMHWEMQLIAQGGMSNARVLRAATLNGATTLGLEQQIGSLEVGKLADLIVLAKNPLEDLGYSDSVIQTMVGGRLYDSYSMDEIGNHPKPRSTFYWERGDDKGTGWNNAASFQ